MIPEGVVQRDETRRLRVDARDCAPLTMGVSGGRPPCRPSDLLRSLVVRGSHLDAAVREAQLLGARFYRVLDEQPAGDASLRRR